VNASDRSLLSFIDAPVVVGDPSGNAVWANPAFHGAFGLEPAGLAARPLAELFSGGGRERVLGAIVQVCQGGGSERFPLREGVHDYHAVVSAIEADGECVGVVILLKEGLARTERLIALHRRLDEPIGELAVALDTMLEQTGGRREQAYRDTLEEGLRALERLRKYRDEASALLAGEEPGIGAAFDPRPVLQRALEAARRLSDGPVDLLAPAALAPVRGDDGAFESALVRMASARLAGSGPERLVLAARTPDGLPERWLLVSMTEVRSASGPPPPLSEPPEVLESLERLHAERHERVVPGLGRTTLLRLRLS
jgi:hypothetical protein